MRGFLKIGQDVTERRRYAEELAVRQAELRHVSRLTTVGQMVAALSHEVAQPLAAISSYLTGAINLWGSGNANRGSDGRAIRACKRSRAKSSAENSRRMFLSFSPDENSISRNCID